MSCPLLHFPAPNVPRDPKSREVLSDCGTISGMCLVQGNDCEMKLLFQKGRCFKEPILCAAGPILPLLPHNACITTKEPCLSHLKESLEELSKFTQNIKMMATRHKGLLGKTTNCMKVTKRYERVYAKYSDNLFVPIVNKDYTGGCLSGSQTSEAQYLCLPTGPNLQTLSLYKVVSDGRLSVNHPTSVLTSTKLPTRIFQVDTAVVSDSCTIGVRTDVQCLLYKIRHLEEDGISFKRKRKIKFSSKPMSISMSPYIEGECVTLTADGNLQMWDAKGSAASEAGCVTARFSEPDFWGQATYSSHPRQVLVTDRTGVAVWDMRMGPRYDDVFVLPTPLLRWAERLMVGQPHPRNPFYHIVATQETLLMLDHRFPRLPVLEWRHQLVSPPQYITVVTDALPTARDDVIMVSSQEYCETLCYQVRMATAILPPVSTSAPWRLAKPEDLFNMEGATLGSMHIDLKQRLAAPLIGITALKNKNAGGFSVAQLTSYGDLFGQQYVVGAPDMERTWCSGPGSTHLRLSLDDRKTTQHWQTELLAATDRANLPVQRQKLQTNKSSDEDKELTAIVEGCYMPEKLRGLLPASEPESWCKLCGKQLDLNSPDQTPTTRRQPTGRVHRLEISSQTTASEGSANAIHKCPGCQLTKDMGTSLYNDVKMVIPSLVDDNTVDAYLDGDEFQSDPERFASSSTQILVKLWKGDDFSEILQLREDYTKRMEGDDKTRSSAVENKEDLGHGDSAIDSDRTRGKIKDTAVDGAGDVAHSHWSEDKIGGDDSDASSVLCRADGATKGHRKRNLSTTSDQVKEGACTSSLQTKRKRGYSTSKNDSNDTLTMFSQLSCGTPGASTSFLTSTPIDLDKSIASTLNQTQKSRKNAKRARRSVMGF